MELVKREIADQRDLRASTSSCRAVMPPMRRKPRGPGEQIRARP